MNKSYKIKYQNESLSHHGILGQKWGKRNGPPYPLDYEDHSSSQKKLNSKSSLNNYSNNNPKKSNKSKGFKLTDKQKTYIKIGLAATATILVAYGAYRLYKNGNVVQFISANDANKIITENTIKDNLKVNPFLKSKYMKDVLADVDSSTYAHVINTNSKLDSINSLDKWKPGENTIDNVLKTINKPIIDINPDKLSIQEVSKKFNNMSLTEQAKYQNRLMNCMLCSTSYELNRRGIKCQAGVSSLGLMTSRINDIFDFKDPKAILSYDSNNGNFSKFLQTMNSYPNKARGNIIVNFKTGGTHSMAWEVINGKLNILDAQVGKQYTPNEVDDLLKNVWGHITSYRTDNADLKENSDLLLSIIQKV